MYLILLSTLCLVVITFFTWRRILAFAVVTAARRKKLRLTISTFSVTSASGIVLELHKGPIAKVEIDHAEIGLAPGILRHGILEFFLGKRARFRAFTRGITLHLRTSSSDHPPSTASNNNNKGDTDNTTSPEDPAGAHSPATSESTPSSHTPGINFGILNLLIVDIEDLSIRDDQGAVILSLQSITMENISKLQSIRAKHLKLLPYYSHDNTSTQASSSSSYHEQDSSSPASTAMRHHHDDVFHLDQFELKHEGHFSSLIKRKNLGTISFVIGCIKVNLMSHQSLERTHSALLLCRNSINNAKKSRSAPQRCNDSGYDEHEHEERVRRKNFSLSFLPKQVNIRLSQAHLASNISSLASILILEHAVLDCTTTKNDAEMPDRAQHDFNCDSASHEQCIISTSLTWKHFSYKILSSLAIDDDDYYRVGALCPALEIQCSTATVGCTASSPFASASSVSDTWAVASNIHVNSMHTRIQHGAVGGILRSLPQPQAKASPLQQDRTSKDAHVKAEQNQGMFAALAIEFKASLGDGSTLQFLDEHADCIWLSSLHSASLYLSNSTVSDTSRDNVDSSSTSGTMSKAQGTLSIRFEATEISMSMLPVAAIAQSTQQQKPERIPQQILSARLVRLDWNSVRANDSSTDTSPPCIDIITSRVRVSAQPASMGAVADVASSILQIFPTKTEKKTGPPKDTNRANTSRAVSNRKSKRGLALPMVSFQIEDTLLVAPTTVTVPQSQSSTNKMQYIYGTVGMSVQSFHGCIDMRKFDEKEDMYENQGSVRGSTVSIDEVTVVYCEGFSAQRFPDDPAELLAMARVTVLSLSQACWRSQRSAAGTASDALHGGGDDDDGDIAEEFSLRIPSSSSLSAPPKRDENDAYVNVPTKIGTSAFAPAATTAAANADAKSADHEHNAQRCITIHSLVATADADAFGCAIQVANDMLAIYFLLQSVARQRDGVNDEQQQDKDDLICLQHLGTSGSELDATDIVRLSETMHHHHEDTNGHEDGITTAAAIDETLDDPTAPHHECGNPDTLPSIGKKKALSPSICIEITNSKLSLPLPADQEVSLEIHAMHAEIAPSRRRHALRCDTTSLCIKGKPIVSWKQLSCTLHHSARDSATPLPLQPLPPLQAARSNSSHGMDKRGSVDIPTTGAQTATGYGIYPTHGQQQPHSARSSLDDQRLYGSMYGSGGWSIHSTPVTSPTAAGVGSTNNAPGRLQEQPWHRSNIMYGSAFVASSGVASSVEDSIPSVLMPYCRAGLKQAWIDSNSTTASNSSNTNAAVGSYDQSSESPSSPLHSTQQTSSSYLGNGPRAVADVSLIGFELCVPYDREPGPTLRLAEMYAKAVEEAFTQSLKVLRKKSQQRPSNSVDDTRVPHKTVFGGKERRLQSSVFPLQMNFKGDSIRVRFEHHPMEAWLSRHGPLLQQAAMQRHMWTEAMAAVNETAAEGLSSPLHAGLVDSALADATRLKENAKYGNNRDIGNDDDANMESALAAESLDADGDGIEIAEGEADTKVAASPSKKSIKGGAASRVEQAWEGLMRSLSRQYKNEVQHLKQRVAAAAENAASSNSINKKGRSPHLPCPDLLLVSVDTIQALMVVCGGSQHADYAALSFIHTVDPISADYQLIKARKLHVDIGMSAVAVKFAGAPQPMVSAARLRLSGPLAVAKQLVAPPATTGRVLAVGAHRVVTLTTNVRGCKGPFKIYTDCSIESSRLQVCWTAGYEASLALVGMAGKRLAPSDPDKTAPKPPPVPWWDDLRYLWRGNANIQATRLRVTLAAHQLPAVGATSERMEVNAAMAKVALAAGDMLLELHGVASTLYKNAGMNMQRGGTLLVLPFVHSPYLKIGIKIDWKLSGGRSGNDHYLFPAVPDMNGIQSPVVIADLFKAQGMDIALNVHLGTAEPSTSSSSAAANITVTTGASSPTPSSPISSLQRPADTALGFLGDHQVAFIKLMVHALKDTPTYIKAGARRGTFFVRKPRGGPPKKGLPKLLQLLNLSVSASPIEIVHFTIDANDPSAGLCLGASTASFGASWLCNQPVQSFLKLPSHLHRSPRQTHSTPTRTIAQDLSLNFADLAMYCDDPSGAPPGAPGAGDDPHRFDKKTAEASSASVSIPASPLHHTQRWQQQQQVGVRGEESEPWTSMSLHAAGAFNSVMDDEDEGNDADDIRKAAALLESLVQANARPPLPEHAAILRARTMSMARTAESDSRHHGGDGNNIDVRGGGGDPSGDPAPSLSSILDANKPPHRPLCITISDCRFLVDLSTRNAVWGAVAHLVSAFASDPKPDHLHRTITDATSGSFRSPSPVVGFLSPSTSLSRRDLSTELQRRISSGHVMRSPSQNSEGIPETNELLSLLLQQRNEAGGSGTGSSLPTPQATAEDEISVIDGDQGELGSGDGDAPMTSPLDDVHSMLKYEVEVINLQVMIQNKESEGSNGTSNGRLLLAAKSSRLRGLTLLEGPAPLQITTLGMEAVQAYVSITDVDPHASLAWLQVDERGGFCAPPDGGPAALNRIFNPIRIDFRHSKVPSTALTTRRAGTGKGTVGRSPTPTPGVYVHGGGNHHMTKSEEIVLRIPEVAAVMDGKEFEVVLDVVSLLLTPGPTVTTINAEKRLLLESENEEVEDARHLFALVRQELACIRREAFEIRRCMGLQMEMVGEEPGSHHVPRRSGAEIVAFSPMSPPTSVQGDNVDGAMHDSQPTSMVPVASVQSQVQQPRRPHSDAHSNVDIASTVDTPRDRAPSTATATTNDADNGVHARQSTARSTSAVVGTATATTSSPAQVSVPHSPTGSAVTTRDDAANLLPSQGTTPKAQDRRDDFSLPGSPFMHAAMLRSTKQENMELLPVEMALREYFAGEALAAAAAAFLAASSSSVFPQGKSTALEELTEAAVDDVAADRVSVRHSGMHPRESDRSRRERLTLLLRWAEEQEKAALATYDGTKSALLSLKAAASKRVVTRSASRVLLKLDRIVWQLCSPEKQPFVQASLRGLSFDRRRNRDLSGSAKFVIHRIEIVDTTGALPEGPATPPGVILTVWNPDPSYEREPVLHVIATIGVPTSTHVIFEHLDATLHPLSAHVTESIAASCWEYFFPKEDSKTRQEVFAQSVSGKSRKSLAGGGDVYMGGDAVSSPFSARSTQDHHHPGTPFRGQQQQPSSSRGPSMSHHRGGMEEDPNDGMPRSFSSHTEASSASVSSTPMSAASNAGSHRALFGRASTAHAAGAGTAGGSANPQAMQSSSSQQQRGGRSKHKSGDGNKQTTRPLKRFVYVKLNRAHMRITYQGYPIGIKDRILVVNSYTCENLEGRWRDLLANVKQKAILSAVWSTLGLQGRKIKELMEGAAPAASAPGHVPGAADEHRGTKGLLNRLRLGGHSRNKKESAHEMTEEEVKTFQKKRALFGDHMLRAMVGVATGGGGKHQHASGSSHQHASGSSHSQEQASAQSTTSAAKAAQALLGPTAVHASSSAPGSKAHSPISSAGPSSRGVTPTGSPAKLVQGRRTPPVPTLDLRHPLPPDDHDDNNDQYLESGGGSHRGQGREEPHMFAAATASAVSGVSPSGGSISFAATGGGGGGSRVHGDGDDDNDEAMSPLKSGRSRMSNSDQGAATILLGQAFQQQQQVMEKMSSPRKTSIAEKMQQLAKGAKEALG